jgi:anthraniloyl-CoA monooxygenase
MKVVCVGADPAALYLGILLKRRDRNHTVRVLEIDGSAAPLPSSLVCNPLKPRLRLADADVLAAANAAMSGCDRVTITTGERRFETGGLAYAAIHAAPFVAALTQLATDLGCEVRRCAPAAMRHALSGADLIVAADPAASQLPGLENSPAADVTLGTNWFVGLASAAPRHGLSYSFATTAGGTMQAISWPHPGGATVVVDAPPAAIRANALEQASPEAILAFCRQSFSDEFDGVSPPAQCTWQPFVTRRSRRWHAGKTVLLGRAAYTSHFSLGLGLRASLEDAEALAEALNTHATVDEALAAFDAARRPKAESLQRAAGASQSWFEHVDEHMRLPFDQFVFSLLTANMRITYARIEKAAPDLVRSVDALIAPKTDGANRPPPPMFAPITLRGLTIPNRVVVSPMCMYSAKDGTVNDWHVVHLGSRAVGGAGLVISEMTDVLPEGRISLHCAGMYAPEHVDAWRRVTDFIHQYSAAKVAVQLAHAGRKGSLTRSWEGHKDLGEAANWEILAASAIPFGEGRQTPRAMNRADMDKVRDAFARAAEMSDAAGFDMIELHFAHGYLISSFISPASNKRTDEYGGSLENRMRFPLEVFNAVRAAWPQHKPISTRISSVDWVEGGTTIEDAIAIARMLHEAGNDILSVSSGGVVSAQPAVGGRVYQASLSDRIRNALGIPTMSVGGIVSHGDINTIIAAGRADMCALGRGSLEDAYFVRHAAREQNYGGLPWPSQYRRAGEVRLRGA